MGGGRGVGRGSLTSLIARNLTLNADEAPNYKYILRKQAYSNILKISPPKNESFSDKNSDIFHISALKNIDCGYSLEPPSRGGSNEYPQSMF